MSPTPEPRVLEDYLRLPYPVTLYAETDGDYVAEIRDLPGCATQGSTAVEALRLIEEAKELWIETALDRGIPVPVPGADTEYSGRVLLRIPRSLHRKLADGARADGVSLNQHLVELLARGTATGRAANTVPAGRRAHKKAA